MKCAGSFPDPPVGGMLLVPYLPDTYGHAIQMTSNPRYYCLLGIKGMAMLFEQRIIGPGILTI